MTIYFPFFLFVFLTVFCRWLFLFSFSVIASTWSTAWERAPGWLKSDLDVGRRGSGRPGRCKGHWAHGKLLVTLENEAGSARIGAQQLGEFGQVAAIFWMSFSSRAGKWFSRKSQRWKPIQVEPRVCLVSRGFHGMQAATPLVLDGL